MAKGNPHPVLTKEFYENQFGNKTNPSEAGKKGSQKSNEKQREKKKLREALEELLKIKHKDDNITNAEAIAIAMIEKAIGGDVASAIFVRDTTGEKPTDKQETTIVGPQPVLVEFEDAKGADIKSF